jgi:hypothetical protein
VGGSFCFVVARSTKRLIRWALTLTFVLFSTVSTCVNLCQLVSPCFNLFHLVSPCFNLFQLVSSCVILFQLVSSCFNLCHLVSTCFNLFHLVSPCVNLFHLVSTCVNLFHLVSTCVNLFQLVSTCFTLCHLVSPCFTGVPFRGHGRAFQKRVQRIEEHQLGYATHSDRVVREIYHNYTCWWYSLCNFQYRQHYENTCSDHVDC